MPYASASDAATSCVETSRAGAGISNLEPRVLRLEA